MAPRFLQVVCWHFEAVHSRNDSQITCLRISRSRFKVQDGIRLPCGAQHSASICQLRPSPLAIAPGAPSSHQYAECLPSFPPFEGRLRLKTWIKGGALDQMAGRTLLNLSAVPWNGRRLGTDATQPSLLIEVGGSLIHIHRLRGQRSPRQAFRWRITRSTQSERSSDLDLLLISQTKIAPVRSTRFARPPDGEISCL